MDIVLAIAAAIFFAFGTVLQQKAGLDEPSAGKASGSGRLLQMVRRPVWLAGIATDALGFVCQAVALSVGRLAVVQPLLVSSVVFALPIGARLTGQRVRRGDVIAASAVVVALVVFLAAADPTGGSDDAPVGQWVLAGGICAAAITPLLILARSSAPARKAAMLGTAAGILFALSAALTKATTDQFGDGVLTVSTDWHLYALIAVGYASMTLSQLSLDTGALAPAIATSMAFDPVVSVVLGVTLLDESLQIDALTGTVTILALAAAVSAIAVLSRTRPQPSGPSPTIPAR